MKKYYEIYNKIKADINNGYLNENEELYSLRKGCDFFKVSITTMQNAYNLLLMEGYIKVKDKQGYYVAISKSDAKLRESILSPIISDDDKIRYNLKSNSVDNDKLDNNLWKKYIRNTLDNMEVLSYYGEGEGESILRKALAKHIYLNRNVLANYKQIIIGSNYQSLLNIICGLLDRKTVVGIEYDGFKQAEQIFKDYKFKIKYIDTNNLDLNELNKCDIFYLNSSAFSKDKKAISEVDKKILIEYSKNHLIIEDDHNGELRYATKTTLALQSNNIDSIIYLGSFSKILMPSLRIAYMVLPKYLLNLYQSKDYSPTASKLEQLSLANYILDGNMQKHISRLKKLYRKKYLKMNSVIKKYFNDYYLEENALCFRIRINIDLENIYNKLKNDGISFDYNDEELIVSFASIDEEDMEFIIKRIYDEISAVSKN